MSDNSRLIVVQPRRRSAILAIIFVIIIIIVLIVVLILVRRSASSVNTTTGTGSTQCVNDVDCTGSKVCSPEKGLCVDCIDSSNCPVNAPICDTTNNKCVGCLTDSGCPNNKPICDEATKRCVQCSSNNDCGGAAPNCNPITKICVGCLTANDCPANAPICSPGVGVCVQCLTNNECNAPATCTSGFCCDTSAPTLTSIAASFVTGFLPRIFGTYSFGQPPGSTAVFQVLDPSGFLLLEAPGSPADGTFSITQAAPDTQPRYFASYSYLIRVRISQPCGATAFSNPLGVTIPYNPDTTIPVIVNADATPGGFNVYTSTPDITDILFYTLVIIYVIPAANGPLFDLNRAAYQPLISPSQGPDATVKLFGFFPFVVSGGEQYWVVVTSAIGYYWLTPSAPFLLTVTAPPP